ncbi:Virulence-associated protein E [Methylorubrum extorquens]
MMDLRNAALLLGGEVSGQGIVCPGLGHSSRDRSLSVMFSPSAPSGFIVFSHAGDDPLVAKDYVRDRLSLERAESKQMMGRVAKFATHAERDGGVRQGGEGCRALRLWAKACDPTDSPVQAYLQQRGLSLPGEAGEVLRYHPDCPFAGTRTPAMIALVRNIRTDAPQAIHRTALSLDGCKVTVAGKERAALGPIAGGAVKLTTDAGVTTCLGIGEGIESTLSLRYLPEFGVSPVWSVLNEGGVSAFPVLSGIECLWIAVDHDSAGITAAERCAHRWRHAGREVFLVKAVRAKADLNDVVQEVRHG